MARLAWITLALVAGACTTRSIAPVEERRALAVLTQVPPGVPAPGAPRADAPAEPDWRPPTYTVKRGDTLHAIALEHGLDYRELAGWNAIDNPNLIRVGQVLQMAAPGDPRLASPGAPATADSAIGVVTAPLRGAGSVIESRPASSAPAGTPSTPTPAPAPTPRNTDLVKVAPKAVKEPYSAKLAQQMAKAPVDTTLARADTTRSPVVATPSAPPPSTAASPTPSAPASPAAAPASKPAAAEPPTATKSSSEGGDLDWSWPAKGKLVTAFSDTANLKGIDIAGAAGEPVLASAPGRVVYAGSGLRGYGKLVIIKHNNTFLSAYAHNRDIVVKEGQQVTRGQKIAEMGSTDAEQVKLHFEIRRLGRPMDPLKFLPPA